MKCIKATRKTINHEAGDIVRIQDKEAEKRVKSGAWSYIPKSEWKQATRVPKTEQEPKEKTEKRGKKNEKVS